MTIYSCVSVFQHQTGNGEVSLFSFSFSVQISHKLLFVCDHSDLLSRWSPLHWSRAVLVTINYQGRARGGSVRKDQGFVGWRPGGPRVQWVVPERTQIARGDAQEDQGRVCGTPKDQGRVGPEG